MNPAVITDLNYRMALPAIWSLSKLKVDIIGLCPSDIKSFKRTGFYSRFVKQKLSISNPKLNSEVYIAELIELGKKLMGEYHCKPVLIVVGSASMQAIVSKLDILSEFYLFLLPDEHSYYSANNTYKLSGYAMAENVYFPNTNWLAEESIEELECRISYPCVIKYRFGEGLNSKASERYKIVKNKEEFISSYEKMHSIQASPLAQEYVSGSGFGVSVVFDEEHEPVEIFMHERLRELPISGGPSTLCRSTWNQAMVDQAIKLLKALKWRGYAMVEFKGTIDGFKLMEINPRFWGSMAASFVSGMDFASSYYLSCISKHELLTNKGRIDYNDRYKLNIKMQFFVQDLVSSFKYALKHKKISYLLSFIIDTLNPQVRGGLFRIYDPLPSIAYFLGFLL